MSHLIRFNVDKMYHCFRCIGQFKWISFERRKNTNLIPSSTTTKMSLFRGVKLNLVTYFTSCLLDWVSCCCCGCFFSLLVCKFSFNQPGAAILRITLILHIFTTFVALFTLFFFRWFCYNKSHSIVFLLCILCMQSISICIPFHSPRFSFLFLFVIKFVNFIYRRILVLVYVHNIYTSFNIQMAVGMHCSFEEEKKGDHQFICRISVFGFFWSM